MRKIKYGCIILLMFITILSMFSVTVYADAMDYISLKTTSPIPDDPNTPFVEQDVHDKLLEIFGDTTDVDVCWNTTYNDFCKYAYGVEMDGEQIVIYMSHRYREIIPPIEDDKLIVDGPCFGFESPWDRFVYEIESIKQFFKANQGAFVMFLILVVCCIVLLIMGIIRLVKHIIKNKKPRLRYCGKDIDHVR